MWRHGFGDAVAVTGACAGLHLVATFKNLDSVELSRLIATARERDVGLHSADQLHLETRRATPC